MSNFEPIARRWSSRLTSSFYLGLAVGLLVSFFSVFGVFASLLGATARRDATVDVIWSDLRELRGVLLEQQQQMSDVRGLPSEIEELRAVIEEQQQQILMLNQSARDQEDEIATLKQLLGQ